MVNNLDNAKFLDSEGLSEESEALQSHSCDTGLPPGCDCVCHQACDFGKNYSGDPSDHGFYEMK